MKQFLFLFFYIESIATSRLNIVTMIKHKNKNMIQNDIIKHYCYKKLTPLSQKHTKINKILLLRSFYGSIPVPFDDWEIC